MSQEAPGCWVQMRRGPRTVSGQAQAVEGTVSTRGMRPFEMGVNLDTDPGEARRPRVLGTDEERPSHPSRDSSGCDAWCPHGDEALAGGGGLDTDSCHLTTAHPAGALCKS